MKTATAPLLLAALLASAAPTPVLAEDIVVEPGPGTLQAAIEGAADGDVLILTEGAYTGNLLIDRSLTIRAQSRSELAYVGQGTATVDGAGIHVTLQGLTFDTTLNVDNGAEVNVLENRFLSGKSLDVSDYETAGGDGSLAIIGNRLDGGSISSLRADDAYVAGNTLLNGMIRADRGPAWIVGNEVRYSGSSLTPVLDLAGSYGEVKVLANRVYHTSSTNNYYLSHVYAIKTTHPNALIAGNLLWLRSTNSNHYQHGIHASGFAQIQNNLIYWGGGTSHNASNPAAIYAPVGRIAGNIVHNFYGKAFSGNAATTNNLCYGSYTASTCGSADDGNLTNTDPLFADTTDFLLAEGSPAIDAGPEAPYFADLDRTRNDLGPYGGPWSIGQYDAQRAQDYLAPYVYPLFKANASIAGGQMQIQALGVARLR